MYQFWNIMMTEILHLETLNEFAKLAGGGMP